MLTFKVESPAMLNGFLRESLGVSGREAKRLIDSRSVLVNGRRVWISTHALYAGDTVVAPESEEVERRDIVLPASVEILYKSSSCLVINKPAHLLSNGKQSAEKVLQLQLGEPEARAVHRLDADTTGCLLVCRRPQRWDFFVEQFKKHTFTKRYLALVSGKVTWATKECNKPLDGRTAKSIFRVQQQNDLVTLLEVEIVTGRTHQIRRHLEALRLRVVGDKRYGQDKLNLFEGSIDRQMLHAVAINFQPDEGQPRVKVTAPLPNDFIAALKTRTGTHKAQPRRH